MKTSIKRVLVPLDPSPYTEAATARACEVAKSHQAQISGLAVLDSPGIRSLVAPADVYYWPLVRDAVMEVTEHARSEIEKVEKRFAEACQVRGANHVETDMEGVPADLILEASGLYDLTVIGLRTFFHFETRETPGDSLAKILRRTVTPILAVPKEDTGQAFQHAMVAYDGSLNSARALREFAQFAKPMDLTVTLVSAHDDPRIAQSLLDDAGAYFNAHDLPGFFTRTVQAAHLKPTDLEEADLVVAGIHSGRFFKDLMVGSFTKAMIEKGDTALFLSH